MLLDVTKVLEHKNTAELALLTVRYRSAQEAIQYIVGLDDHAFYQHPFIGYCQKDAFEKMKEAYAQPD